mmetsp:Transcript_25621/g.74058  ORF Transcript_25621/g.74058 Transcript_25621/m.74058 type:complete len:830 (+) Transcript_25621:77-2566(+)
MPVQGEKRSLLNGKATLKQLSALRTRFSHNDKCANCKESDPSYVCLDFLTFVCQECCDVHREFGHKIASLEHSEWTDEEYAVIEKGGNRRASEEFLAFWNQDDFPQPTKAEPERLRNFIRKAYVIKCWQRQPDTRGGPRKPWSPFVSAATPVAEQPAAETEPAPEQPPEGEPRAAAAEAPTQHAPALAASPVAAQVQGAEGAPDTVAADAAAPQVLPGPPIPPFADFGSADAASPSAAPSPAVAGQAAAAAADLALDAAAVAPGGPAAAAPDGAAQVSLGGPAPGCPTAPPPFSGGGPVPFHPAGLVFLQKDAACFCTDHDSTEKRVKQEPAFRHCNSCGIMLQTNYSCLTFCPGCSGQRGLCMICGAAAPLPVASLLGNQYGPDGMPKETTARPEQAAASGGASSDGTHTPVTSNGNAEGQWEADFSSSDVESTDASGGTASAPPPADGAAATAAPIEVAPAPCGGALGNLMDLDFDLGEVKAEATSCAVTSSAAAPPGDWLGDAVMSITSTAELEGAKMQDTAVRTGALEESLEISGDALPEVGCGAAVDLNGAGALAIEKTPPAAKSGQGADDDLIAAFQGHSFADSVVPQDEAGDAAASAGAGPELNLGERLRSAVMQGSTDAVMGLFKEFESPAKPTASSERAAAERAAAAAERAAAVADRYAAFGELGEPKPQLPTAQLPPSCFSLPSHLATPPRGAVAGLDLASAVMSPQHLDSVSSQHLTQLHAMVSHALQQRNVVPQTPPAAAGVLGSPSSARPEGQSAQFGDVLTAFHERNSAWEDKRTPAPAKAPQNSPSRESGTPGEFDDLLAAFHKKNPIAGYSSP